MLFLIPTPIGNLKDITLRALEALKECDLILCEDKRHSHILLSHYNIDKPLKSWHKFNEASSLQKVIEILKEGKKIALISDAGTPGICDPGARLVAACREEGISVTALPGACSPIVAFSLSGIEASRFQFVGFLPKKERELEDTLRQLLSYQGLSLCFETPHRLLKTLRHLEKISPTSEIGVAKELTKKFETYLFGTPDALIAKFPTPPKGEFVLLLQGNETSANPSWELLTIEEHVLQLEESLQLSRKEAIQMVARLRSVPKRRIYNTLVQNPL